MTDANAVIMIDHAQAALENGTWVRVHFHGIGGGWLPVEIEEFLEFLDHLVSVQGDLWVGTYGSVYKYIQERDTSQLTMLGVSDESIRLNLTSEMPSELYDEPLTLITEVPLHWTSCEVTQAGEKIRYEVVDGFVQYEAVPGLGEITLVPIS